jgi:hypothetical protein
MTWKYGCVEQNNILEQYTQLAKLELEKYVLVVSYSKKIK